MPQTMKFKIKINMNKILTVSTLLMLALTSCKSFKEVVLKDKQQWKWNGLNLTEEVLRQPGFPENNTMAIFLNDQTINNSIKGFDQTEIISNKLKSWGIKVINAKTSSENGITFVTLQTVITNSKRRRKLGIDLIGQLNFSGVTRVKKDSTIVLHCQIVPLSIVPNIKYNNVFLRLNATKRLIADLATIYLESQEQLDFEIPLTEELNISLRDFFDNDKVERIPTDDEKGFIELKHEIADIKIKKFLNLNPPAFVKNGVWLSFSLSNTPMKDSIMPIKSPPFLGNNLSVLNAQISDRINQLIDSENLTKNANFIWLNKNIFEETLAEINALEKTYRTIKITSTKTDGYITKQTKKNDILGEAEASVRLTDHKSISSTINIEQINLNWLPNNGFNFSYKGNIKAHANVHVHVDPFIGGGIGADFGITGTSDQTINGMVQITQGNLHGKQSVYLSPNIDCINISVKGLTDDAFKFDYGWTKIPSLGATIPFQFGDLKLPKVPILTSIPLYVVQNRIDTIIVKKGIVIKDTIILMKPFRYLVLTNTPDSVSINNKGMALNFHSEIEFSNDSNLIVSINEEQKRFKEAVKAEKGKKPDCPEKNKLLIHLGDLEIGPNNELVKWISKFYGDVVNGPGENNDLVKILDNIGNIFNDATKIDEGTLLALKELSELSGKVFGKENDITQNIQRLTNEVEKWRATPGKAIGDVPKNLLKEGKKAFNSLKEEAKKRWKKPFG